MGIPAAQTTAPQPSIFAKQRPRLAPSAPSPPCSRQAQPCLPKPAWVGPCLLPEPAARSAQGRVPGAGCHLGRSLAPPPPPGPATSASEPRHGTCLAERRAGHLIPRAGNQEEGPDGQTLEWGAAQLRASHHNPRSLLLLQMDPSLPTLGPW